MALRGRLVFRVPLLVAQSDPSELKFVVSCAGTAHPVSLRYAPAADATDQGVFFDQPEDAILFLVDHVRQGDFMGALSATAAGSTAEAYDYARMVDRLQCITPVMSMSLPSDYPAYVSLNRLGQQAQLKYQLNGLIQSLLVSPDMVDGLLRPVTDGQFEVTEGKKLPVKEYIALLDPARLQGLRVRGIYRVDSAIFHSEANRKNIQKQGAIYGYSDSSDFLMVYELGGKLYQHSCSVGRFEKGWQVLMLVSPILGADASGRATFLSEDDAQALESSGDFTKAYPKG